MMVHFGPVIVQAAGKLLKFFKKNAELIEIYILTCYNIA